LRVRAAFFAAALRAAALRLRVAAALRAAALRLAEVDLRFVVLRFGGFRFTARFFAIPLLPLAEPEGRLVVDFRVERFFFGEFFFAVDTENPRFWASGFFRFALARRLEAEPRFGAGFTKTIGMFSPLTLLDQCTQYFSGADRYRREHGPN